MRNSMYGMLPRSRMHVTIHCITRRMTVSVSARGVSVMLSQERLHRFYNRRIDRRRSVVVKIDRLSIL